MKSKIKFLPRLILLTLFLTLISCNEELYEIKDQHNGLDKNKISLTQFKNETNIGRIDPILSVRATKSLTSKIKTQLSDFVIDTLAIKKLISENNKTTYTFRIYPLFAVVQPNDIYNLVYYKVNDTWETSIFYLKKLPEENSEHKLFEKIERIYGGKVTNAVSSKATNLEMCATEFKTVECNGSCRLEGYSKCDGFSCSTGECISRIIIYGFCSSGSGGGGGTFGDGTVYGGGGTSGGTYSYAPNYFDNPAFEDPSYFNELNKSSVLSTLSPDQQDFFSSNPERNKYFNKTIQYQIDNQWSDESFVLSQEMRIRKFDYPTVFKSITPFLIEKKIDDTQLSDCLKGIMEQLKKATNADIANVMAKLDATNEYNLTMKMGTVNPGKYAATTKVSKNNYLVTVTQNNFTTASKLYKATALLHEIIHAYMLSIVDDYNTYPTNAPFTNFPELFKTYVSKINKVSNAEIAQHEDMANKYVNAIASALEEYQWNDTGIPSTLADKQVFLDLAWSGLQGTDVYNKKSQEGIIDNTRITARIGAEQNGVYSQGQYAVGKQCN